MAQTTKTRALRRRSTRSAGQEAIICPTASAMKPSEIRLTAVTENRTWPLGAIQTQPAKLKAVTSAQTHPCHQRRRNSSSNRERVNNQNTTMVPVDIAISGACQSGIRDVTSTE